MSAKAYAQAGVNIALAENSLAALKPFLKAATRPEVLGGIGNFGGLFDISKTKLKHPVLVSSTDGVGTKLKVAQLANKHEGVGHDIVNHCLNDIAVMGAEPLFFLDYYGTGKLDPKVYSAVLKGVAAACKNANCALIGGETAEMPGVYSGGDYDLVGTIIGIVDRKRIITGAATRPGDIIIGLGSNGLHTNGYSLARRIIFDKLGHKVTDQIPGAKKKTTFAQALLQPHTNYSNVLRAASKKFNKGADCSKRAGNHFYGAAHLTGGGFTGNIPRVLPDNCDVTIFTGTWTRPVIFDYLEEKGGVSYEELHEVFNMGIGMTWAVSPEKAADILNFIEDHGLDAWPIGCVTKGKGIVHLERA